MTHFRGSCNGVLAFSAENHPWCPDAIGQNWRYLSTNRQAGPATWMDAGTGLDIMPIQDTGEEYENLENSLAILIDM